MKYLVTSWGGKWAVTGPFLDLLLFYEKSDAQSCADACNLAYRAGALAAKEEVLSKLRAGKMPAGKGGAV